MRRRVKARGLAGACLAAALMGSPSGAWAQDDEGFSPMVEAFTTIQLAGTSVALGCLIYSQSQGGQFAKAMGAAGCVTSSLMVGVMAVTSTVAGTVESFAEGEDQRDLARALALEYVAHEADALSVEVALGGGAHLSHLSDLLEGAVGGPIDPGELGACVAREREALWGELARRGEGHVRATRRFIGCAEASRC